MGVNRVACGFGALFMPPVQRADVAFSRQLVGISYRLGASFGGHATRDSAILSSPGGFGVEMRDGCSAVNVTILLFSGVVAFRPSISFHKNMIE